MFRKLLTFSHVTHKDSTKLMGEWGIVFRLFSVFISTTGKEMQQWRVCDLWGSGMRDIHLVDVYPCHGVLIYWDLDDCVLMCWCVDLLICWCVYGWFMVGMGWVVCEDTENTERKTKHKNSENTRCHPDSNPVTTLTGSSANKPTARSELMCWCWRVMCGGLRWRCVDVLTDWCIYVLMLWWLCWWSCWCAWCVDVLLCFDVVMCWAFRFFLFSYEILSRVWRRSRVSGLCY